MGLIEQGMERMGVNNQANNNQQPQQDMDDGAQPQDTDNPYNNQYGQHPQPHGRGQGHHGHMRSSNPSGLYNNEPELKQAEESSSEYSTESDK
eukprot:UN12056